ncbi:MAG: hypothetical protein AABX35_04610 [Nanoarchaeota archaeon]
MKPATIKLREEERRSLADKMLLAINDGKSFSEITKSNGMNLVNGGTLLKKEFGKNYRQLREEAFKKALSRVETGELELFQLRDNFEFSPSSFYGKLCAHGKRALIYSNKEEDASPERLKLLYKSLERNGNGELDALLRAGLPLVEIGVFLRMHDVYVENYMFGSGQHYIWKRENKHLTSRTDEYERNLKLLRSNIVGILLNSVLHLEPADNKKGYTVEEKTIRALALTELRAGRKITEKNKPLQNIFHEYFQAEANGQRPSIRALSLAAGYKGTTSGLKPIRNIGLPLLYKQPALTSRQEELISRARKTPFSVPDIHYFLGIPLDRRRVEKRMRDRENTSSPALVLDNERISYSTASQVYQYLGEEVCKISELGELIPGMSKEIANSILDNRANIEPVIIAGLKTLYPRYKITTPYFFPRGKS